MDDLQKRQRGPDARPCHLRENLVAAYARPHQTHGRQASLQRVMWTIAIVASL